MLVLTFSSVLGGETSSPLRAFSLLPICILVPDLSMGCLAGAGTAGVGFHGRGGSGWIFGFLCLGPAICRYPCPWAKPTMALDASKVWSVIPGSWNCWYLDINLLFSAALLAPVDMMLPVPTAGEDSGRLVLFVMLCVNVLSGLNGRMLATDTFGPSIRVI